MFFVSRGSCEAVEKVRGQPDLIFNEGRYFGEICLLKENRRTKTIRAKQYLDLCVLSKDKFNVVLEEHTESAIKILRAMELKVAEYSKADHRWKKLRKAIYMNASEQIKESSRALAIEMASAESSGENMSRFCLLNELNSPHHLSSLFKPPKKYLESGITTRGATVMAAKLKDRDQNANSSLIKVHLQSFFSLSHHPGLFCRSWLALTFKLVFLYLISAITKLTWVRKNNPGLTRHKWSPPSSRTISSRVCPWRRGRKRVLRSVPDAVHFVDAPFSEDERGNA